MNNFEQIEKSILGAIDSFTEKLNDEVKNNGQAHQETKDTLSKLESQLFDLQKEHADAVAKLATIEANSKRLGASVDEQKTFKSAIVEAVNGADLLSKFNANRNVALDVKATMTTGANLLGNTIRPQRINGVIYPMPAMTRVREALTVVPLTTSNAVDWIRETVYNNNAGTVSEGSNKQESDVTLDTTSVPVQTIAHTMRLHKNILADLPLMATYLSTRGVDGLLDEEDEQLLYGNGTPPNLIGLLTDSDSAFNPTKLYAAMVAQGSRGAGYYDILRFAALQVRLARMRPNAIFLSPADKAVIDTLQIEDGAYRRQPDGTVLVTNIWGIPVAEVDSMNEGEFAVGAFNTAATLFEREGVSINFYYEDRDNVQKNLVTVLIEERIALGTQRPQAIVTGEFSEYLGKYAS